MEDDNAKKSSASESSQWKESEVSEIIKIWGGIAVFRQNKQCARSLCVMSSCPPMCMRDTFGEFKVLTHTEITYRSLLIGNVNALTKKKIGTN